MTLLNPTAMAVAAALTIPPLVALYFLKLRRTVHIVSSTLLWRRSVEDLQVNAPFQRLRRSLLFLLQLLILIAGALALGKPMLHAAQRNEGTVILMIDQSASMAVTEPGGHTRLEEAKRRAKESIDNMAEDARAMVIAFCDRATVVSSFDTDKDALKRKIDSIEQTQSRSMLGEAVSLAGAYAQNMIIGREGEPDVEIRSNAPPASVFLFTDGRLDDADRVAVERLDTAKMRFVTVGTRSDNVGIVAMDARRNYERPEILEVAATVENFGPQPVTLDAALYVAGQNVDVQTTTLAPADAAIAGNASRNSATSPSPRRVVAFDEVEFGGGGIVQVVLNVDDALSADDRAWTVIDPPRRLRVLLVGPGNVFLDNVLATFPLDLTQMSGLEYENADDPDLVEDNRSAFDVVILDRHSTARLPQGNYLFFGAVPQVEGVSAGRMIDDEIIFNWDDTHPILRHVSVETLRVYKWLELHVPPEAEVLIEGQTSPVLAYLTRGASQFLICAFSLIAENKAGAPVMNTFWVTTLDFVVFMQNAIQFLSANVPTSGQKSILPGEPLSVPLPAGTSEVRVDRPDGTVEDIPAAGADSLHYARTRQVGVYRVEPGLRGHNLVAVNLFDPTESRVEPVSRLAVGLAAELSPVETAEVNRPAWHYVLMGLLVLLVIEWIVYNRRVLM